MRRKRWIVAIPVLFLLNVPGWTQGKMTYKLSAEGGLSHSSFGPLASQQYLLARFNGQLKYFFNGEHSAWALQGSLRPDLYLAETIPSSVILQLKGEYLQQQRHGSWGVFFENQRQRLRFSGDGVDIDVFQLGARGNWFVRKGQVLTLGLGYNYRDFTAAIDNQLDALVLSLRWSGQPGDGLRCYGGLYGENFRIRSLRRRADVAGREENRGWRYGPELGLEHKKALLLSGNYRLLLHQSELTDATALEHRVRLLFGKILTAEWSLFALFDYYFRNQSYEALADAFLFYTPVDTENRFYLKLERDMGTRTDAYLKIGYVSEDFTLGTLNYAGWQGTVGIEISR